MSHRRRSWKVENTWKCSSCGHHNKGHEMTCSSCGNPKDKSENYLLGDITKPVTDAVKLMEASAGPNWSCTYCRFDNRNSFNKCQQCGSDRQVLFAPPPALTLPLEVKAETKLEHDFDRWKRLAGLPTEPLNPPEGTPLRLAVVDGEYTLPLNPSLEQVQSQANAPKPPEKKRRMISPGDYRNPPVFEDIPEIPLPTPVPRGGESVRSRGFSDNTVQAVKVFFGSLAVALFLGGAVWLFAPHEHNATVSSVHWQYTRELQQRYTRHGEDWGSPAGAFNVSCERRQHGTEDCHPHDCNAHQVGHDCHGHDCRCHTSCEDEGNGYSSCSEDCDTCYDTCYTTEYDTCYDQCPVYDNWCNYDYYQWVHVDTETTSGNDHNVVWGHRFEADGSVTQRIVTTEEYTVIFIQGGDHWTYSANTLGNFNRFNVGVNWDVKTNYAGMIWPQHIVE